MHRVGFTDHSMLCQWRTPAGTFVCVLGGLFVCFVFVLFVCLFGVGCFGVFVVVVVVVLGG